MVIKCCLPVELLPLLLPLLQLFHQTSPSPGFHRAQSKVGGELQFEGVWHVLLPGGRGEAGFVQHVSSELPHLWFGKSRVLQGKGDLVLTRDSYFILTRYHLIQNKFYIFPRWIKLEFCLTFSLASSKSRLQVSISKTWRKIKNTKEKFFLLKIFLFSPGDSLPAEHCPCNIFYMQDSTWRVILLSFFFQNPILMPSLALSMMLSTIMMQMCSVVYPSWGVRLGAA